MAITKRGEMTMEQNMAAKDAIKRARYKLQLNQTEFAKALGVHKSVISLYENGKRKPSFPKIRKYIAKLAKLGVEVNFEDFLDDEND